MHKNRTETKTQQSTNSQRSTVNDQQSAVSAPGSGPLRIYTGLTILSFLKNTNKQINNLYFSFSCCWLQDIAYKKIKLLNEEKKDLKIFVRRVMLHNCALLCILETQHN